ncbi:hypothetical protein DY000_02043711 [Brassica cretica]|uniref:Uncharacterized protein n=1 Tax=Brassica cretica TaxID=69181 RepID=A0ABQ7BGV8_BRACR|nr:hypothetical protein DY000_02043711 [Brassica cretica]
MNTQPLKSKVEVVRPSMKSVATFNQATRKKSQQVDIGVILFTVHFLISFDDSQVDMDALHDQAMLIPMVSSHVIVGPLCFG